MVIALQCAALRLAVGTGEGVKSRLGEVIPGQQWIVGPVVAADSTLGTARLVPARLEHPPVLRELDQVRLSVAQPAVR
jgi:hypothetical protein